MDDKLIDDSSCKIEYSEKVTINIKSIFSVADADVKKVLWRHLLTISAIVDPTGKAKQILLSTKDSGKEGQFISNILDKIETSVDPNSNPMDAVQSIMSSGVFTDLMSGMGSGLQDGSLDIGKLMSSVQGMVSGMEGSGGGKTPDIGNMMGKMMGGQGEGAPPDIGKMMGAMMGGQGDGAPPDIAKMMGAMMGGQGDGAPPDIAKMMGAMMGGQGDGAPPDIAKMMGKMMEGLGGTNGSPPDLSKIIGSMNIPDEK
jgi:hypothetical protein